VEWRQLQELVRERAGIAISGGARALLEPRLAEVWRAAGLRSLGELLAALRRDPAGELADRAVEAVANHETSFFRDGRPFQLLQHEVLPALIKARGERRRLRIWCAAAASGQEPYSLAMLLADHFPQLDAWDVDLLGSDFSSAMLQRAARGVYSAYEVARGLAPSQLARHFTRLEDGGWQLHAALRRRVRLERINLVGAWPELEPVDLLLARNVLIYFEPETRARVLEAFRCVLAPDGWLLLGGPETTLGSHAGYALHKSELGICFRPRPQSSG
jgi:chemotaxis protein methyltransferase CheR